MQHVDTVHGVDSELTVVPIVVDKQPADILADAVVEEEWGSMATEVRAVGAVAGDGGGVGSDGLGGVCGRGKEVSDGGYGSLG
jgi:hypothetical protein